MSSGPTAPLDQAGSAPGDLDAVVAEIHAEVARRRRSGEYPPGLERELDAVFARHAPPAALGDDMAQLLEQADRAAFIDVDVPTASNRPGVPYVKAAVRKSMGWYQRFVAQQVSAMGGVMVRVMRRLDDRVSELERHVPAANPRLAAAAADLPVVALSAGQVAAAHAAVAGTSGRVVHLEADDGSLVASLVAAGVDAYGVEPRRDRTVDAVRSGLEVRVTDPIEHLRAAAVGSLDGVVLSGAVDRAPRGAQVELAELAAEAVADRGVVVVLGTDPEAWDASAPDALVDLSPGRPMRAGTWAHLLVTCGLDQVVVEHHDAGPGAPRGYSVVARRS